jgi:NADPH:quinone reductase-like Zn-dependent oxidoreductase
MKAIVCLKYGPPEVLQLKEIKKPSPSDTEVLIKVFATSVNTGDCNARELNYVPPGLRLLARLMLGFKKPKLSILGSVFSGLIEAVGKHVKEFAVGDPVFGIDGTHLGTYAEFKCISEEAALALKPANLTHPQAAAIPFGALTAWHFLSEKGKIKSGQKVLILGASGNVGSAAVQIAKSFGAKVTGVCSTAHVEQVKSLGADEVIDYTREDFRLNGEKYDLILDTVLGKTSYSNCKNWMTKKGIYLAVAGGIKALMQMLWTSLFTGRKVIFGGGLACERKESLQILKALIESEKLIAVIDKEFPLEKMAEAHRYFEQRANMGNVVISM